MCERTLYRRIDQNFQDINRLHGKYFQVAEKIQLKMKLLDTKVINGGVYIDRTKNLSKEYYDVVEGDDKSGKRRDLKITYKKKQKLILGKEIGIDFEQLMSQRKP